MLTDVALPPAAARPAASSSASSSEAAAGGGVLVRLLRGTYTVRVAPSERHIYYPEEATLDLTRVPLPRVAGAIDLPVPMRAAPRLRVMLLGAFGAGGSVNLVSALLMALAMPFGDAVWWR